MDINKQCTLVLNKAWQVIDAKCVHKAITMMASDAAVGLDIHESGAMTPVCWEDWQKLPVRETDLFLGTPNQKIRVPTVIIAVNYAKVPLKRPHLNMKNLRMKYQDTCAYTGRKLTPKEMSKEHIVPVSKGGKNTWYNVVLADREVNSKRGNKELREAGLTLKVVPSPPVEFLPEDVIRNVLNIPEWDYFLASGS